jgi:polysaccharide biosynthesis transport protein
MHEFLSKRLLPPSGVEDTPVYDPGREDGWHDLLFITFKWLPQMVLIVLLGVGFGFAYLVLIRADMYEATAKLYVKAGMEQASSPLRSSDPSVTYLAQARGAVQSEIDLLHNDMLVHRLVDEIDLSALAATSEPDTLVQRLKQHVKDTISSAREVLDQTLAALDLKTIPTPEDAMRVRLSGSLQVESSADSDVIVISLRWPDPEHASALLGRLVELFLEFRSDVFEGGGEIAFLELKRDEAKRELESIEAEMTIFEESGEARNAAHRIQLLESELVDAQRDHDRRSLDLALAKQRLERITGRIDTDGNVAIGTFPADSAVSEMAGSLITLLGERSRLLATSAPDTPEVREFDAQVTSMTALLRRQLESEAEDRASTSDAARDRLDRISASLRELQTARQEWNTLERLKDMAEPRYREAEERLERARDINALRQARLSNLVLVQPAIASPLPVGMRSVILLAIISLLSVVVACGWALLREMMDNRLHQANRAARLLGLPLLGDLPEDKRAVRDWVMRTKG